MLNLYDEILIEEVNKVSQEKKDFTFLGLYLANEKNVSALKILNWLTVAIQQNWIAKEIDFNKKNTVVIRDLGSTYTFQENIPSKLIENPMYVAKEVLDYISKTNKVDFNFRPYKNYSLKEMLAKVLVDFQNPESSFYQCDRVAEKTLEIIFYFSQHTTMNINSTMQHFLLTAMKQDIPLFLKQLIVDILSKSSKPHKKYATLVEENLEAKKNLLLLEQQHRFINEVDYRYFMNNLCPKLKRHEIKLK